MHYVKNSVKVQVCNLRLIDNIEQIGHSDATIEWSSDEHLDIKTAFELFRSFFLLEPFRTFSNFILNVSNFITMIHGCHSHNIQALYSQETK